MTQKLFQSGELDFAYDEPEPELAFARYALKYGVYVKVVQESGPGGGWPVVRLIGDLRSVVRAIRDGWQSGDEETDRDTVTLALADGGWVE